jgi:hypothetical protein
MFEPLTWKDWLNITLTVAGLILGALSLSYGKWIIGAIFLLAFFICSYFIYAHIKHRGYSYSLSESQITLEFETPAKARLYKVQRLRPNLKNLTEYIEEISVDGEVGPISVSLEGHESSCTKHGIRYGVSVRHHFTPTLQKGVTYRRRIEYELLNSFPSDEESYDVGILLPTKRSTMTIIFPHGKPPRKVWGVLVDPRAEIPLMSNPVTIHNNRPHFTHDISGPILGRTYRFHWLW